MSVLAEIDVASSDCVYIHRGRNPILTNYFIPQCVSDYTYDFRGLKRLKWLNSVLAFIKSFIFALEIEKNKFYVLEGGMFIFIGVFLKILHPKSKIIMNIADPTLAIYSTSIRSNIKRYVKINLLRRFDFFVTNSPMIKEEATIVLGDKQIVHYYLPLFDDKLTIQSNYNRLNKKTVLFLITRPNETGRTKGLDVFCDIAKHPDLADYKFILGGAGSEILDFADYKNVYQYGHFANVSLAYEMADVIIIPSYYDSYPCVSIECFASGILPIVSAKSGSNKDLKAISSLLAVNNTCDTDEWVSKIIEISELSDTEYLDILTKAIDFANDKFRKVNHDQRSNFNA